MEDVNKRRRISFSLSKLECGPQEINSSRKFAYTCHFQQIGINGTKIEKTGIHYKTDVFAAVAVVDAKAPFYFTGVLEFNSLPIFMKSKKSFLDF